MRNSRYIVYALVDPRNGQIRYVGKSTVGRKRARAHLRTSLTERTHKASWVRQLLNLGMVYDIVILERVEEPGQLAFAEKKWISALRFAGARLTNMTDGGDGIPGCKRTVSEVTREKLRRAATDKKVTPETRVKMSFASRGRLQSEESRRKKSESMQGNTNCVGRIVSDAARHNMSEAAKKRFKDGEHPAKGLKRSAKTRSKISAARKRHEESKRLAGDGRGH